MNFPDPNVTTEYESPDGLKYVWNGFAWEIECGGGYGSPQVDLDPYLKKHGDIVDDCNAPPVFDWNKPVTFQHGPTSYNKSSLKLDNKKVVLEADDAMDVYAPNGVMNIMMDTGEIDVGGVREIAFTYDGVKLLKEIKSTTHEKHIVDKKYVDQEVLDLKKEIDSLATCPESELEILSGVQCVNEDQVAQDGQYWYFKEGTILPDVTESVWINDKQYIIGGKFTSYKHWIDVNTNKFCYLTEVHFNYPVPQDEIDAGEISFRTCANAADDVDDELQDLKDVVYGKGATKVNTDGRLTAVQFRWDINTNIDCLGKTARFHMDGENAVVFNHDIIPDGRIDWEEELKPYPNTLCLEFSDGRQYVFTVQHKGNAGTNGRGKNFEITDRGNLPVDVSVFNGLEFDIYKNYVPPTDGLVDKVQDLQNQLDEFKQEVEETYAPVVTAVADRYKDSNSEEPQVLVTWFNHGNAPDGTGFTSVAAVRFKHSPDVNKNWININGVRHEAFMMDTYGSDHYEWSLKHASGDLSGLIGTEVTLDNC